MKGQTNHRVLELGKVWQGWGFLRLVLLVALLLALVPTPARASPDLTWTQTTQAHFEAGVTINVDTSSSPGDVKLNLVPNPTLVTSDNNEVSTPPSVEWQLVKELTFSKTGSSPNELRIDSDLKVSDSYCTVYSSIRVDGEEKFSHSTSSTSYVSYNDVLDFSGYSEGEHTVKLYLKVNEGTGYNATFELYRTSPTLITSDNSEDSVSGDIEWHLTKTLTFTKSGPSYDNLRIDSNLRAKNPATAYSSIRVDGEEKFSHSTKSTSYVSYSDFLDFSDYSDGEHTVELYLKTSNKNKPAYNSKFELYRTSPTLITSDNSEVSVTSTAEWQLLKILSFTNDGPSYDELRIDSNLRAINPATAYSSIRVDGEEKFSHSTTSTSYQSYSDVLDFSSYADGEYTVKLYLKTSNKNKPAYNSVFELYRTKAYSSPGSIASQVLDTGTEGASWTELSWSETLQANTDITFEVRASDSSFSKDSATPGWGSAGGTSPVISGLPSGRYMQWRATLTTSDTSKTPTLHEVTITYNQPPSTTVALYQSNESTPAASMDPQVEYAVKVSVTDNDTLDDINEIRVILFYDAAGNDPSAPGTPDTQTCAILTWTKGGSPEWDIAPSEASSNWRIEETYCKKPSDMAQTSGDWWFHFKPGKVATHSPGSGDWDIYAKATDTAELTAENYLRDVEMNWYGEITVNTPSVNWGTVNLGSDFSANPQTGISVTYICNGSYNQQVKSDGSWSGGGASITLNAAGSPGEGEFSLKADDTATLGSAVLVSTSYVTIVSGSQTDEAGNTESFNTLWLKLGPSGIPVVTYSGTIYYQIAP